MTNHTIKEVVADIVIPTASEQENAVLLHNFVREKIKFGFNKHFDAATPVYTLACGIGHCNAKSRLMVAFFRAIHLEAHQHFVAIPKDILRGAIPSSQFWMMPSELSHSFVEVKIGDGWCQIDSFTIDTPYLKAAQTRLAREGKSIGYGIRLDSDNTWDGKSNSFSQFDRSFLIEDHGRIDDLDVYFRSKQYRNRFLGISFNTMFKIMGEKGVAPINANIESIRQS